MVPAEHSRVTPISGSILAEKVRQFHRRLHGEESVDDFKGSQEWLLDQLNGAEANRECISSEEPEGELGDTRLSAEPGCASFSSSTNGRTSTAIS